MYPTKISLLNDKYIDQYITILGWVRSVRQQKKMVFLKIFDSWNSEIQVVINFDKFTEDEVNEYKQIQIGWSLMLSGLFVKSLGKGQDYELIANKIIIYGKVDNQATYPLAKAEHTMEHYRQYPQLECRSMEKSTIYGIRDYVMKLTREFFHNKNFVECTIPLITFSECEGGCQPMQCYLLLTEKKHSVIPKVKTQDGQETDDIDFTKDFFKRPAYLTVSGQLELKTQLPLGSVFTITRAVRGEPSISTKHLCEFSMLEIELLSLSSKDIIDVTEEYIKFVLKEVLNTNNKSIKFLESKFEENLIQKLELCRDVPFIRKTHAECITILRNQKDIIFEEEPLYDGDLASEHERYLVDIHFKSPVVVMRYPKKIKSFYMPIIKETEEESRGIEHVDSFDILVPGLGELVGGSQRIHDLQELENRITELGIDSESLDFYIDLRRKGTLPHGGMGLGIERFIKYITGAPSVRDCVSFPRYYMGK